jgi:segregation and condensation protein B
MPDTDVDSPALPVDASPDRSEMTDGAVVESELEPADADEAEEASGKLASVEALLFSTRHPLTAGRLVELAELQSTRQVRVLVRELNGLYEQSGRAFRIEQVAGGYQMLTLPEHGAAIKKLVQRETDAKLTRAALETLAIIAYKQPILRVDVESIRGVASGETIRSLMEKHLVKIAGRADEPGRPILYGTTKRFLEVFGLNALGDLPKPDQTRPSLPMPAEPVAAEPASQAESDSTN